MNIFLCGLLIGVPGVIAGNFTVSPPLTDIGPLVARGEGRHQLARHLFFANQGAFQTGDYEEIMNKATCLSFLSNAVLVWNTMHMTRIVEQLRAGGATIDDAELSRVSPVAFSHVIPNGTYFSQPFAADPGV